MLKRGFFAALGAIAGSPLFRPCPKVRPDPTPQPVHTPTAIHGSVWTDHDLDLLMDHLAEPASPVTWLGLVRMAEIQQMSHRIHGRPDGIEVERRCFRLVGARWFCDGVWIETVADALKVLRH